MIAPSETTKVAGIAFLSPISSTGYDSNKRREALARLRRRAGADEGASTAGVLPILRALAVGAARRESSIQPGGSPELIQHRCCLAVVPAARCPTANGIPPGSTGSKCFCGHTARRH